MADDIKLPPLPRLRVPLIEADVDLLDINVLARWCERTATDYARAAVLADREGRQQDKLDAARVAELERDVAYLEYLAAEVRKGAELAADEIASLKAKLEELEALRAPIILRKQAEAVEQVKYE
ncbi:hypothetical protein, partial [Priestia megaterium]|uniref:hypothetical protein n=1 Tax=Priestia megaterium TaxID=1404 RepID=UPI0035B59FE5